MRLVTQIVPKTVFFSHRFHAVLFLAAGGCMWDLLEIHYNVCVHGDEGTFHPVQHVNVHFYSF